MPDLKHLVVVFEPEAECRAHLERHGYAPEMAREIATYLAQATDLRDFEEEIRAGLHQDGIDVTFVELAAAADALPRLDPSRSMVWCQTDGIRFYRGSSIPALTRLLGLARYGSPPTTQHLCQDKFASLALAQAAGVPVPPTRLLEGRITLAGLGEGEIDWETASLFVKPATLGAKIGIFADSRCQGLVEATRLAQRIWDRYGDRAIVQGFVDGDDVRVSFMDTGVAFADHVGIARLRKNPASEAGGAFMTMRDNETLSGARDTSGRRGVFGQGRDAAFTPEMEDLRTGGDPRSILAVRHITRHADRLKALLPLHDYFSMDFRIDSAGQPTFLEFETCPAVTIYDFQHYLSATCGLSFGTALARSLRLGFGRLKSRPEA